MNHTLKEYQNSVRELDTIETLYKRGGTDILTLQEARQRCHEAAKAWEEERSQLTETQRIQYAQNSAHEETTKSDSAPAETELQHIKRLIKECRKELYNARDANKALYTQLATNRETKRRLNDEYKELRQRKKQLEKVNT